MCNLYHPGKANVVADALCRSSVRSTTHIDEEKRELAKDVHRIARLVVTLIEATQGCIMVTTGLNHH